MKCMPTPYLPTITFVRRGKRLMGFTNALWRQIDHLRWWMILVLAIGIRLTFVYYLYSIYITPGGGRLSLGGLSDTTYHYGALQLLQGSIATGYFAYHAPLMAMLIAVVYALFGVDAIYLVVVVQAIFSAATCLFAWSAAKTLGLDDRLGKTAALLLALDLSSIGVKLVIGAEVVSNFSLPGCCYSWRGCCCAVSCATRLLVERLWCWRRWRDPTRFILRRQPL